MRKFVLIVYSEVNMFVVNKQIYAKVWYVKADERIWKHLWKN